MERKHRIEMKAAEIANVESLIHNVNAWDFSHDHVMERCEQKGIRKGDLVNCLRYGRVIEVNDAGRAVLRLNMKGGGVVVVASLAERVLVTAWKNANEDNHATLNRSEYGWKVNAADYVRSLLS